jgi:hypothetical protein
MARAGGCLDSISETFGLLWQRPGCCPSARVWRGEQLLLPREAGADDSHLLDKRLGERGHGGRAGPVALEFRSQNRPCDLSSSGFIKRISLFWIASHRLDPYASAMVIGLSC